MDKLHRAVALIQRSAGDRVELLLRRDDRSGQWRFICGERLETESFRQTVQREVAWQLQLDRAQDFLVANASQLAREGPELLPGEIDPQYVAVEFFQVYLYGQVAIETVARQPSVGWFSCREVCQGATDSGQPIDPVVVHWLNKWQIVQPWQ